MVISLIRILFGLFVASLAAGLTQVLFVITPAEIASLAPAAMPGRLGGAGLLVLLAATQTAVFSAPFALIAVAIGEWKGIGSWIYYVLAGLAIAGAAFLAQYTGEQEGATIVNDYALRAFLATGLIAGLTYWALSGRYAGGAKRKQPAVPSRA